MRSTVRINGEDCLAVVMLAVHKGDKQPALFRAQHILEDARVEVVMQFLSESVTGIAQHRRIAGCSSGFTCRIQLFVRIVREPENQTVKRLDVLLLPAEYF